MQKLEWWLCQVVKNIWWYIQSFWFHTTKWQTGIQTNKSISICRHAIKLLWLLKVLLSQFCNISFHSTPAKIRGNIDSDCWLHCTLNCTVYCNRPCRVFVGPPYYSQLAVFASSLSTFSLFYYVLLPALHNIFNSPLARYNLFVLKVPLNTNRPLRVYWWEI